MRTTVLLFTMLLASLATAEDLTQKLLAVSALCEVTQTSCDTSMKGKLEPGDCTLKDGTLSDIYRFHGVAGQTIEVELRALSTSFTTPMLMVFAPPGNATKPAAAIAKRGVAKVRVLLTSSGEWGIGVATMDLFAHGDYVLVVRCASPGSIPPDSACLEQEVRCGGSILWSLDATSCRFVGGKGAHAQVRIQGRRGSSTHVQVFSTSFKPAVALWDGKEYVAMGSSSDSQLSSFRFTFPDDRAYWIVSAAYNEGEGGDFMVMADCLFESCVPPIMLEHPKSIEVGWGKSVSLSAEAHGTAPMSYAWYSSDPNAIWTGQTITHSSVTQTMSVWTIARNACGTVTSGTANIEVKKSRRRLVKR